MIATYNYIVKFGLKHPNVQQATATIAEKGSQPCQKPVDPVTDATNVIGGVGLRQSWTFTALEGHIK